jgi:hypothetical protein
MSAPSGTQPQPTLITKQMRRSNCNCQQTNGYTLSLLQSGKAEEPRTIYVDFELHVSSKVRNINKTKVQHIIIIIRIIIIMYLTANGPSPGGSGYNTCI